MSFLRFLLCTTFFMVVKANSADFGTVLTLNKLLDITYDAVKTTQKNEREDKKEADKRNVKQEDNEGESELENKIKKLKEGEWIMNIKTSRDSGSIKAESLETVNKNVFQYWFVGKKYNMLNYIDCKNKKEMTEVVFEKKLNSFEQRGGQTKWNYIIPGSVGEDIYNEVCK